MAPKVTRQTILIGVGALVLLAATFGVGAWVGADWVGRFFGYQVLPRANANANLLHHRLVRLDKGDTDGLREEINMELDDEILAMCVLVDAGSGSSNDAVTKARATLQRIAKYRAEKPATYPATYQAQLDDAPKKRLKECLDGALPSPVR